MNTVNTTRKFIFLIMMAIAITINLSWQNPTNVSNETDIPIKEVKIGNQVWMAENLNVDYFSNGEKIPEAKSIKDWVDAGKKKLPAWCYYANKTKNGAVYGKLYNWYAVTDPRGLAPKGWRIPSKYDLSLLLDFYGGEFKAGEHLKAINGWKKGIPNSNISRFNGLPGGIRGHDGSFFGIKTTGWWWSGEEDDKNTAFYFYCNSIDHHALNLNGFKEIGLSVRCIKVLNNSYGKL